MTQPKLVLYDFGESTTDDLETYSPFCLKVRRALRRADLAYATEHATSAGTIKKVNPLCQVPVLTVDGEPVIDSSHILQRIEALNRHPMRDKLTPAEIADALLWEELADTSINGFVVAARWADEDNWMRCRDAFFAAAPRIVRAVVGGRVRAKIIAGLIARDIWRAGSEACWARFEETLDQLDRRAPEQGFWVSEHLSVADMGLFGQLQSLRSCLTPRQAESVEKRARLRAYLDRIDAATIAPPPRRHRNAKKAELAALLIS